MDKRTLEVARTVEIVQKAVSAGAKVADPAAAARLAGVSETDIPIVAAEIDILLRSVLKPRK